MPTESDPRVFFAAERTLLAWLRTGLAVMGLGFVVARFGLFLRVFTEKDPNPDAMLAISPHHGHVSSVLGVSLVTLAVAMIVSSAWQFQRFFRSLQSNERPRDYHPALSIIFAYLLALTGLSLAVSLVVWTK
jgi:inner membrane protein YidH